ncbi:hypothetical protein [Streptomyces chryseus]|uniref:Uncharacterized protein n=1 Tax=Streptomyces chryseus TaxID=68186 RepID=A0ABQ3EAC5_9ACTN|nr:hypothetical protein [Streptomyces chryseus]GHB26087.1 hypothetical protein GCM10010346_57160 [Streptomyces chryseus]
MGVRHHAAPESQGLLADVLQVTAAAPALGWPTWLPARTDVLPFTPAGSRLTSMEATVAHIDRRALLHTEAAALVGTPLSTAP